MNRALAAHSGVLAVTAASAALLTACASHTNESSGAVDAAADRGAAGDAAGPAEASDAPDELDAVEDSAADGSLPDSPAPSPYALLRFANWSPDAPAVDVCTAPHGSGTFTGPIVGAELADAGGATLGAGGASGLPFPLVTSYVSLTPGSYDVRIVAAGATSCGVPVIPDVTTSMLTQGVGTLMALVGDAATGASGTQLPGLAVVSFTDETEGDPGGPLVVRFINASPTMNPAALGTGSLGTHNFVALFPAVSFGQVGSPLEGDAEVSGVDEAGYSSERNFRQSVLSVHAAGSTTDAVTTMPVSTQTGIAVTLVAVGGTSGAPVALTECLDTAGTVGPLSTCFVLP